MILRLTPCFVLLAALAGCEQAAPAPAPSLDFRSDPGAYAWRFAAANEPVLALDSAAPGSEGVAAISLSCPEPGVGVLRTTVFALEPVSPPLEFSAGTMTFSAPSRRVDLNGRVGVEAAAPLPDGWKTSLTEAERVALRYGDQGVALAGPDRALAEAFAQACAGPD